MTGTRPTNIGLREDLDSVDWNFLGSSTPGFSVHSLHFFPGASIPQIPAYLIQLLSGPGDLVVDPFCGTGTTGCEALRLGRDTWLSDICTASLQITRSKLALVTDPTIKHHLQDLELQLEQQLVWSTRESDGHEPWDEGTSAELALWYHPDTLHELRDLWSLIQSTGHLPTRDVLVMLFTDVLFACASPGLPVTRTGKRRRHHWGWIADNVKPRQLLRHDPMQLFRDRLGKAAAVSETARPPVNSTILRADARDPLCLPRKADLIVTSPPYLGMIDYARANRTAYLWMNWPFEEDARAEIGARASRNRKSAVADYVSNMTLVAQQFRDALRAGGYCAIVIGSSRRYPEAVDHAIKAFESQMMLIWGPTKRLPSRRRVSDQRGRAAEEFIAVFQNA